MATTPIVRPPSHPDRSQSDGVGVWLDQQIKYYEERLEAARRKQERETPGVYEWKFWTITALVTAALVATVWWIIPSYVPADVGIMINPRYAFYVLVGAYVLASFFMVDTDEIIGLAFFGRPMIVFDSGLKWAPWLIFRRNTESIDFVQAEFPGDNDRIQWGDEKAELLPGQVRPIYVLFAENPNGTLPSDKQMNVGVAFLTKIRMIKSRFFDLVKNLAPIDEAKREEFLKNVTGGTKVTNRMLEALRHLRDTGATVSLELAGQLSYNETTTHLTQVNRLLMLRFEHKVASWGIELVEGSFTKIDAGHTFNTELQKRGAAISARDAKRIESEGTRDQLKNEGEGRAQAARALLEATAEGYKKIMTETGVDGAGVVSSEVAKALAQGQNNTIVVDGATGLMGLALAGAQAIKGKPQEGQNQTPPQQTQP